MADAHDRGVGVLAAATAGVVSVVLGAGLGELVAGVVAPASSPFAVVGGALIDSAPSWAKDTAISLFGTGDKAALLTGIAIVLLVVAAAAGWLESRLPPWGRVVFAAFGVVGVVLSFTRADASLISWVPSAVSGIVAAVTLGMLMVVLHRTTPARRTAFVTGTETVRTEVPVTAAASTLTGATTPAAEPIPRTPPGPPAAPDPPTGSRGLDRRAFFIWAGAAAAAGVLAAVAGSALRAGSEVVAAARSALKLPSPTGPRVVIPAAAELGIPGLSPVITPNADFYRIDTALIVPQVDTATWSLRIHGLVENEVTITWDELLALPLEESVTTLTCVSNEVGSNLIGNARWLGYPIRELLARAKPTSGADMVLSHSIDGFTASTPLEILTDDRNAILAVGMNGQPLPAEHGFPVRMVVPGLYGYVSATKWVVELEVTTFAANAGYWTSRGWSARGPAKLESRIDVPRAHVSVTAGSSVIAGVAWQQHVGVSGVEVQVDDGKWQQASLATAISKDTWVQWSLPWTATSGSHTIRCRATSATGEVQTEDQAPPAPDGATGWHEIDVRVY